jgi:N6-L-threonylcarbamoyladenine synthase
LKILAIETSCDETCASIVVEGQILSNIVSSQIELHKQWGGVVPSIAKRAHEEKIGAVVNEAIKVIKDIKEIDAIAVTQGPGLAIALEVGIRYAKELASRLQKPLIAVNHIEGHVLGSFTPEVRFPALALVVSGGHTELIQAQQIGKYKIVAQTSDDALGEALDKAARMLGLGYPGGAELEKAAKLGNPKTYPLPLPMLGRENQNEFSYSGLKTAMWRQVEKLKDDNGQLTIDQVNNMAASFQETAFKHLTRVLNHSLENFVAKDLLVGGGVAANQTLRENLSVLAKQHGLQAWFPPKGLYGDNAAMIGIAACYKAQRGEYSQLHEVDRLPRWRIDQPSATINPIKSAT